MHKLLLGSIFILFGGLAFVSAQSSEFTYKLKGRIVDQDSAVVPILTFGIKKNDKVSFERTDINGDFEIDLSPGNYEIDSSEVGLKLFLKIGDKETNPQNLELTVNTSTLCKKDFKNVVYPAVLKSVIPKAPAAAQAVRALGEVLVQLSVGSDGKVSSAQAVSGHPLLRSATEGAARQFEFEPAIALDLPRVVLKFIFFDQEAPTRELKRYECPYRIIVPVERVTIIDTADIDRFPKYSFFSKLKRLFGF